MKHITPHAREEHIEYIHSVQESADSDISEGEAVRRIFDRASEAERTESEAEPIRSEYESKLDALRSEHESEIESIRSKYKSRINTLERERDRLLDHLQAMNSRQDDVDELVRYVEDELSYRAAGLATRTKW